MSIPILYDACVLYGNEVRDLLIRPDLSPERLMVTRERMNLAVPLGT
jgi:hypothetical protein